MNRLAVTRASAPAVIRPRAMALGLRGAAGAAALAGSLMARYRLAGTWPADAELQVLTPPVPGAPAAPARAERAQREEPRPPLHIRLSADIRLIRRLLADRARGVEVRRERSAGRTPAARTEVRLVEAAARPEPKVSARRERAERVAPERRERSESRTLPGPAVIRMPAPASDGAMPPTTTLRPIHTHATTETRALLVIRSPAPAEPSTGAPVMAVRTPASGAADRPGRSEARRPRGTPQARSNAPTSPTGLTPDAARPALPGRPANEAVPLEIVRREASAPETPGAEPPARVRLLASRTRAAAARLAAERAPKLAVRSRRGPGPSLDRRTLAGRPAPSPPRIAPIIPRAVGQPGAGDQAAPTRVVARRVGRETAPAILEGAAMLDSPAAPVIPQPAARLPGAPTLTPASPTSAPATPGRQARGDQRRQAVALDVRRAPIPAAPPAPAARQTTERASEPRGQAGQRTAEAKARPPQIDAPTLRKALNELPIGEFEPLADRLIAEFEWQLKRGLERSGRR